MKDENGILPISNLHPDPLADLTRFVTAGTFAVSRTLRSN